MEDRDILAQRRVREKSQSFFALPNLLFGLNFGALAGMTNAFLAVPFFGNFTIYLGQLFVLLCLVVRGLNSALIAVGLSSVVTAFYANDPFLIVVFALELMFVHAMLRRGMFLLQSVMLYWLFVGVPLILSLNLLSSDMSQEVLIIGGLTRAVNGLICVSAVSFFQWFLPTRLITSNYKHHPPRLASLIFSLCMLTVTLPALILALFFINQAATYNQQTVHQTMDKYANAVSTQVTGLINEHMQSLQTISSVLTRQNDDSAAVDNLLNANYVNHLGFEHIAIFDKTGKLVNAVPQSTDIKLTSMTNASNESFFKETRKTRSWYLSDAFYGQLIAKRDVGFMQLAIAAPYFSDTTEVADFEGVVKGAIGLNTLDQLNDELIGTRFDYALVDSDSRILATSLASPYLPLSSFEYENGRHDLLDQIKVIRMHGQEYLTQAIDTNQGWTVHILANPSMVTSSIVNSFYILILSAIFVILAFALVASQLARKITKPLEDIAEHFPDKALHPNIIEESKISDEIVKLTDKLIHSHAVMTDFQQQLEEQVDTKTRQLKQLNRELYSLAQKDGLTQLLNRAGFNRFALTSYRNCVRNRITMSMALIDIDHFKRINDTYGHPFGDKCITTVARILQKHCKRDTDIIGRFGGEEFILMIVGGELHEHQTRIKLISDSIRSLEFKNDTDTVRITVSAGICSIKKDFAIDFDSMIKMADEQLYLSKRTGRDKISILSR